MSPRAAWTISAFLAPALLGCQRPAPPAAPTPASAVEGLPPATPGLEPQEEDYTQARKFRTKLLRQGPAPQRWAPVRLPSGVSEVVYASGDLRLRAWLNAPTDPGKRPAVLFLHGGWAFGEDDWEMTEPLREAGFVVMAPVLRGENGQPGHFTMFFDEVDDVLAAADHLAGLPGVDPDHVYLAGHSAGGTLVMLAAMASDRFRAAASLSGSPDRVAFVEGGWRDAVPFDMTDIREFRVRSPVAYPYSFKCPTRLYHGSAEEFFRDSTRRTALLAKSHGLDVEAVVVPGDHMSSVPPALAKAVEFFRQHR
jgi:dipeptidyl aminopeptidase/acylaminoacyl peptidase